jgi:glyoxylase-like metal-dependent hydrolase (beta-lactamase superfamily II)
VLIAPGVHVVHVSEEKLMHPGGTNVYLVGDRDRVLVDSGEDTEAVAGNILDYLDGLGRPPLREIVVTHSHPDHWGGARRVAAATGARLRAFNFAAWDEDKRRALDGVASVDSLADNELIAVDGKRLRAVHTPGHSPEHLCYFLEAERILFSGDTILGIGTTVIQDLGAYMTSLERLLSLHPDAICPGHGPVIADAEARIGEYIRHRQMRERQILAVLVEKPRTVRQIVKILYHDVDRRLHKPAARNVQTHLDKLVAEGRVRSRVRGGSRYFLLTGSA